FVLSILLDRRHPRRGAFAYPTLFRSLRQPEVRLESLVSQGRVPGLDLDPETGMSFDIPSVETTVKYEGYIRRQQSEIERAQKDEDRKSTRLNSSHEWIPYADFCLRKK